MPQDREGLVLGVLASPIIFGGLGVTLGTKARRRKDTEGRGGLAAAAIAMGAAAVVVGAAIWVFGEELSI